MSTLEVVKYLVGRYAQLQNDHGFKDSVICYAARVGRVDSVSHILSLGCEAHTMNQALVNACDGGSAQSMKVLLDAGADPRTFHGAYIKWACRNGTIDMVSATANVTHSVELCRSFGNGEDSCRFGR